MDERVKSLWIAALRDRGDCRCPLRLKEGSSLSPYGVLCFLYLSKIACGTWSRQCSHYCKIYTLGGEEYSLPAAVRIWSGLRDKDIYLERRKTFLSNLFNCSTFSQIADVLEEEEIL